MASVAQAAEAAKGAAAEAAQESGALMNWLITEGGWYKLVILLIVVGILVYTVFYMRKRFPIVREFLQFLIERKLWWMTPIVVIFVLLAVLIVTMEQSAIAPFIYALF